MDKYSKITKGLSEIIDEELIKSKIDNLNIYWGTSTTGIPSFAYVLCLLKIKDFVEAGANVTILFADIHAMLDNLKSSAELIHHRTNFYRMLIDFILQQIGTDTSKINYVVGSSFQKSPEYIMDLYKLVSITSLASSKKAGAEVVKQQNDPLLSSLIYPLMQALDEEYVKSGIDVQFGGIDQRKIFMLARDIMPKIGYSKRAYLMNPMIPSLGKTGKMSSSDKTSKIDFIDSDDDIVNKINKAYSIDKIVKDNGIISILKYILFELYPDGITFIRPSEYGGNLFYKDYTSFEKDFIDGNIGSVDIKQTVSELIIKFIKPIRTMILSSELLKLAYP